MTTCHCRSCRRHQPRSRALAYLIAAPFVGAWWLMAALSYLIALVVLAVVYRRLPRRLPWSH